MALPKLFERIFWHNNTTPSVNEDNLNSMSKAIDDIDNRVIQISGDILEVVPQIQAYLEQAEDLVEAIELLTENPPYIGANGNWYVWDTDTSQYVDSGIDASITVSIADITMLATDASPYVTNTGTSTDPVFHLYIPRGETGNGIASVAKTSTSGLVDTYTITFTNGQTTTFTVTNGGGMQIDGSNAAQHVIFDGSFTVGERDSGTSIGENSTVLGYENGASGLASLAEGSHNFATGNMAHAEGSANTASGVASHVEGGGNVAGYVFQHVSGTFNDNKSDTLFEVGNGSNANSRSNAFEVYSDGSLSTDNGVTKVKLEDLAVTKLEKQVTLSTSIETTVTFTYYGITSDSTIDVYTDSPDLMYKTMSISSGTCAITFDVQESATTINIRIYIR